MLDAGSDALYTRINEQNRWFGAIFAAQEEARIFVEAAGAGFSDNTYYDLRGVHHGGTIIAQLGVDAWRAHKIRVYIWPQAKTLVREGWIFIQFDGSHPAFAAVKPVAGDFRPASQTGYYDLTSPAAPVIIQVARPSAAVPDFPAFVDAMLANGFHVTGDWVRYTDLETGVEIAWDQSQSRIARVAGKEVDLDPPLTYDSPYVHGDRQEAVVTITGLDGEHLLLDFREDMLSCTQ